MVKYQKGDGFMIVLSGDIGGTNTRLELSSFANGKRSSIAKKKYKCIEYKNLTQIINLFLEEYETKSSDISSLCLAIAGPIIEDTAKFTNIPWIVSKTQLQNDLQINKVALINDFQAVGYGIETLVDEDLYVLQKGAVVEHGVRTVMGAGTGLGVGFMSWDGEKYIVNPTEGGHVSFAPGDDMQMEILKYLRKKYHRVSNERLLCGKGLVNIYSYFRDVNELHEKENSELRLAMHQGDPAAAITKFAIEHQDPWAMQAIDAFISIYGSCAGDLAYAYLPYGGLYIAGGIAPRLIDQIAAGGFIRAFGDKGRLSVILNDIPVYVVLNTDVGLQGSALFASRI